MGQLPSAVVASVAFQAPAKERSAKLLEARDDLLYLTTEEEEDVIPAVHIRKSAGADRTILYSHGNAEDLGLILPILDRMAEACHADIFAYEYPGYSIADGKPSEENCYLAIDAAYAYLTQQVNVEPRRIIAMGRSIGSGPTVDLVSRHADIRGMVLLSAIASGAAIFGPTLTKLGSNLDLDIFRNYEKIEDITCPVLIMHSVDDKIVPVENGRLLHDKCKNAVDPLWVENCGHNNMPEAICFMRIREFLDTLDGLGFAYSIFLSKVASHMTVAL
jgi:pimeloyl-ACP methyl ester carboxylesterase